VSRVELPTLGFGGAPLGNLFDPIDERIARDTVDAAWESGIRLFDTAPLYGSGLSEQRLGDALRDRPRDEYVLSTKVGRLLHPGADLDSLFRDTPAFRPVFDFSRDGVLRSLESSLDRLGVDRIDIVHVHDPDDHLDQAIAESIPALAELRDQGVIGAVGCGMNSTVPLTRIVGEADVDVVLIAGRYTLLDRSADTELLPLCAERDVQVIAGGIFNSGLLADPDVNRTFDYAEAPPETVERAMALARRCRTHDIPLAAAAVQFVLRHPAITSVIFGVRSRREIEADVSAANMNIPDALWDELVIGSRS
jgi:D-threo-aldose 1-dehydrogenase